MTLKKITQILAFITTVIPLLGTAFYSSYKVIDTYNRVAEIKDMQIIQGQKLDNLNREIQKINAILGD